MHEIYVPALGMASDSVFLAEWLRQPGDAIGAGDIVATIETDKAELEIQAPAVGRLGVHRFAAGGDVPSGATIAVVLEDGEEEDAGPAVPPAAAAPAAAAVPEVVPAAPAAASPTAGHAATTASPGSHDDRARDPETGELQPYDRSPRARRAAALAPEPAARPAPTPAPIAPPIDSAAPAAPAATTVPTTAAQPAHDPTAAGADRYREAVAAAVSRSWAQIPHFAVTRTLRTGELVRLHRSVRALRSTVTLTDLLLKAYALALVERFDSRRIDLGLAVATERGVAIPVLTDVARADCLEIADQRRAAVERALSFRLAEVDATVPHSTLSNLGASGVDSFTGIVPLGQTSILTVGAAADRPVVVDGELAVASTMTVTLNVDHRVWDGQHAADVLARLAGVVEQPLLLGALR